MVTDEERFKQFNTGLLFLYRAFVTILLIAILMKAS